MWEGPALDDSGELAAWDADMENDKVEDLLEWMYKANQYFQTSDSTGASGVYRITKWKH